EYFFSDALQWKGPLPCDKWDCNCTFNRQRGCCCGANDFYQVEEDTFIRIKYLWHDISTLNERVQALTAGVKVAFKATIDPNIAVAIPGSTDHCFGPFNTNVPIPYATVTLNDGMGYNPSLGVFTAPCAGVYVFSITVYSSVEENKRLYHKVQLMLNANPTASVWENNREDGEDSATQVVVLELQRGDQVYVELVSGRKLCKYLDYNIFTGYILYPFDGLCTEEV
uniref:Cerebellin 18 n=1 Tax=Seriola dumerili TaxID=41447 RepID=A0A3B4UE01_SERDU